MVVLLLDFEAHHWRAKSQRSIDVVALSTYGSSCHRKHRCPIEAFCAADIKIRLLICALDSRELMFELANSLWQVCFGLAHILLQSV